MSKRHALEFKFTELAQTDIRWPTKGDKAFTEAANPEENATISEDEFTRLVLMTDGYKLAGDALVEQAAESPSDRAMLVFPVLFNYRHFLELSLKYQLATHGPVVGIEANWTSHDLGRLWLAFVQMLEHYGTQDPDAADPIVGEIILEFSKIDPDSYSNRYPVDRKGIPVPVSKAALDLANLADVMGAVDGYFSGCDGYLSNCR